MYEDAVPKINTHVGKFRSSFLLEEDQVTYLERPQRNGVSLFMKGDGAVGKFHTVHIIVEPDNESGTVHTGSVRSSQPIGCSEESLGVVPELGLFFVFEMGSR